VPRPLPRRTGLFNASTNRVRTRSVGARPATCWKRGSQVAAGAKNTVKARLDMADRVKLAAE
jgi:hypothetical protein